MSGCARGTCYVLARSPNTWFHHTNTSLQEVKAQIMEPENTSSLYYREAIRLP